MGMLRTVAKQVAIAAALVVTKRIASKIIYRVAHRRAALPAKT